MFDLEFRDPWFLLLVLLVPLWYRWMATRSASAVTYSTLTVLNQAPRSMRVRLCGVPAMLLALSMVAMAIALAGPRTGDDQTRIRRKGIAIVMVVDRSGSMQARDLVRGDTSVDRLQAVKMLFRQFVLGDGTGASAVRIGPGRVDDVIGLVAFARYADALCPLTLDHPNLIQMLDDLEVVSDSREDGTALGEGLGLAVERLRRHPARSKIAILLTDGVNNAGDIAPDEAADLARAHDIKVYCIGAGTTGTAPMPVIDMAGRQVLRAMRVEIDQRTLEAIAQKTGGRYFRATDVRSLAEIYKQIDRLERTVISEIRFLKYRQWYGPFVVTALIMIGAAGLLAGSFLRRLP